MAFDHPETPPVSADTPATTGIQTDLKAPADPSITRNPPLSSPGSGGEPTVSVPTPSRLTKLSWRSLVVPAALGAVLLWAFWPTLAELAHRWAHDSQYSHGYLVPLFAVVLLWMRRDKCPDFAPRFSWWGVALLALGVVLRFAGEFIYLEWLDAIALLPCLAGLAILFGGKAALRWSWPAIAFLAFMVPLPYRLEIALAHPLQRVATKASNYSLQTLGLPAVAEGNVIFMNESQIGVVEACSGLSMLVIFFALSTALTFVVERPWWQKLLLVVSAVPIALIANITRITVTGVLHETVGHQVANVVFHDWAGWLMMPFALVLLWIELQIFNRLFIEVSRPAPLAVSALGVPVAPAAKGKNRRRDKSQTISPLSLPHAPRRS
jgi:exosortase